MNNGKPLVLIVDDEEINVKLLEMILSANNYEILKAHNGRDALNIIEQNHAIDLIVLDVMMPDIDGFEVCSLIKKHNGYEDIPVILITALTDDESQLKAFEVGAVDFISKPLRKEVINARIKTHLDLKFSKDQMKTLLSEKKKLISELNNTLSQLYEKIAKLSTKKERSN